MRTDINGCSTCKPGQEQFESYYSQIHGEYRIQYDYRSMDGKLFSCIAKTVDDARQKRNYWLWNK